MENPKSKFPTMETSAAKTAVDRTTEGKGTKVMKKHSKTVDPFKQPVGKRVNKKKADGRTYGITSSMAGYADPAIAPVQSNGRVFTAAVNRVSPNFQSGITDLN
jgi:hypothetical protein